MANISTFEHLPNELIIDVFTYLQPAQNFHSFFYCSQRFRKLIKQYVNYSRHDLDKDIVRFSTLHSWYKHLTYVNGGTTFFLIACKGEQDQYSYSPWMCVYDSIHWHFREEPFTLTDKRIEEISKKYPVKLTPSFHPFSVCVRSSNCAALDFIQQYHLEQYEILAKILDLYKIVSWFKDETRAVLKVAHENEFERLKKVIHQAAESVWKEIQELEDVNILSVE
ncbi:unnamed protein product [Adineta ricciae]|uniref:F-box domain-containing protein n=1 Tax=Adineta ricciae TaxID=249248 RepID=A0A815T1H1_ADIRI|nr:unnamed protein product [Adineta ricciae]